MKRRHWLLCGLAAGGALIVGWGALPPRSRTGQAGTLPVLDGEVGINGWIKIGGDGSVLLAMPRSEMGQGVHTALVQLAAEELDVAPERVRLIAPTHDRLYGNVALIVDVLPLDPRSTAPGRRTPFVRAAQWTLAKIGRELGLSITGGSSSVNDAWEPLRLAAATARAQLLGAASLAWKLPVAELSLQDGVIAHSSGERAHFGELAAQAALTPPGDVNPKPRSAWRTIGKPVARIDVPAKVDGQARFGLDVRPAGLVYAAVRHAPMLGGAPGRVGVAAAMAFPGVERVVRLAPFAGANDALAVVGRSTWHAREGARRLEIDWQPRPAGALDSAALRASLEAAAVTGRGFTFQRRGNGMAALASAARTLAAVYHAPLLAHAAMEPMNCTAQVKEGRVTIWAPTQVPGFARALAAQVAGVDEDAVTVHVTYLGGGFGRRLDIDFVGQAVRVAIETGGRPVQLSWSREEDMTHDFYRPAGCARLEAGFDADDRLQAIVITSAGDAITPRWFERVMPVLATPVDLPDRTTTDGLFDLPYGVTHLHVAHVATRHGVPVGMWRSVGHSHNAFFAESFIDEVASFVRQDPVQLRLALLADMPRHAAVLRLAAERAGWPGSRVADRACGVALHESFGSVVAMVIEASLEGGRPRVHRVVCAVDCGTVINPGIVVQQIESGVVFGLSAALYGRIDIVGGEVQQRNFPDYRLLTLAETPAIETHLVASEQHPGGAGEIAVPPVAPALANALHALDGVRRRELPLVPPGPMAS